MDSAEARIMNPVIDQAFGTLGPKFNEPRPQQREILERLHREQPRLALAEVPTGCGKSPIALAYGEMLGSALTTVLTATISLQEQYARDFDELVVLKGRGNFTCEDNGQTADCGTCTVRRGVECDSPYYDMRESVKYAGRVVANYAVYLNNLWYSGRGGLGCERRPELLVCDEGHRLLDLLTDFEKRTLDGDLAEALGLDVPSSGWQERDEIVEWVKENEARISSSLEDAVVYADKRAKKWLALKRQVDSVMTTPEDHLILKTGRTWETAPLWPYTAGKRLFRSANRVLIMSATMYGGHLLAELLGLKDMVDPIDYSVYNLPSPFNPARWPVKFQPVATLNYQAGDAEWGAVAERVHHFIHEYHNTKGVIHVSAAKQIDRILNAARRCGECSGRLFYPLANPQQRGGESRAELLHRFRRSPSGSWLAHYSVGEGESFDDDLARIQLIAKCPYPDLSDRLTKLRTEDSTTGRKVYAAMTLSRVAQIAGRVMRHEKDWGETIILDAAFRKLWSWNKALAPAWLDRILVLS